MYILGSIFLVILGIFFPRTVGSIVIGCLLGGCWWWLFAPSAFFGFIFDVDCLSD